MIKLLVFDWDGTLMDSQARIADCFALAAEKLGLAPPVAVEQIIGLSLGEALDRLYPGIDEVTIQNFIPRYRHWFVNHAPSPQLFPGVSTTLGELHNAGYWMAVATGKSRTGLKRELSASGLESFFCTSRCADEAPSKPHPQMLLDIFQDLDVCPQAAVMIGDTVYDMEMASNAGAGAIAALYGVHDAQCLLQFGAMGTLSDIGQLPAVLGQLHP